MLMVLCKSVWLLLLLATISKAVEFTFDLPDDTEDCFHEDIKRNTTAYLEYQVAAGGQLDVDVTLKDPNGKIVYESMRGSFDSHQFLADVSGVYTVCFGNKFSSFAHKMVYVDFHVGEEPSLPGIDEHATVLTQMETSSHAIHKSLNDILDAQTHHRLREAQGRKRAEDINERVFWWSLLETFCILSIGIIQIVILRSLFSDKKPSRTQYGRL